MHISATPFSAAEIFDRVFALLLDFGVAWKAVGSELDLMLMNNGFHGLSQAGKFLTAYPASDSQAVALAEALHDATCGLAGPQIPSDRRLRPESLVHYRYGAFIDSGTTAPPGVPPYLRGTLLNDNGLLVEDPRGLNYSPPPPSIVDPFQASGVYVPSLKRSAPFADRYLITKLLGVSARGGTFLAIDLGQSPPQLCVLKEFRKWAAGDEQGSFATDWGRREAALLRRHVLAPGIPHCLAEFDVDGDHYVSFEYKKGRTLAALIHLAAERGRSVEIDQVVAIAHSLLIALRDIHRIGIVYRDVSPGNVVLDELGRCWLVDFGAAIDCEPDVTPSSERGTYAYCAPEQWQGQKPDARDDLFSWAVILCELLTSSLPGSAFSDGIADRLRTLRPECPAALVTLICSALRERARRPVDADQTLEALSTIAAGSNVNLTPSPAAGPAKVTSPFSSDELLAVAIRIGNSLLETALPADGGTCWRSHLQGAEFCSPDLYHGAAGVAMFLAKLSRASGLPAYATGAREAVQWMTGEAWTWPRSSQGLYAGEAGLGWAYLSLSRGLENDAYRSLAGLHWSRIKDCPIKGGALAEGSAGRLLLIAELAAASGFISHSRDAQALYSRFLEACSRDGYFCGVQGAAHTEQGVPPLLGLAHGIAGQGYALLAFWRHTSDLRALDGARGAGTALLGAGRPGASGLEWGRRAGDSIPDLHGQCHGSVGIGQFLARLAQATGEDVFSHGTTAAATSAALSISKQASTGLCHGQAGIGSLMLDCTALTGREEFLAHAHQCSRLLIARMEKIEQRGELHQTRPDLMNGLAGVGWFLLRLLELDGGEDPLLGKVSDFGER